jgi:DHA1 family inner membrane transport protein
MKKLSEGALLAILAAVQFTNIVDFMIMMPLGDLFQRELGIQPFQYSILVSAYPLAAFLSSLFGVFFLDKFDRKKALTVAYFGFALGTLSSAFVPNTDNESLNYILFVGTRFFTGLSGGILGALVLSIIGDAIPLERRGKAMGVVMMAFSLAAIVGVPMGLILVEWFDGNWHAPFLMVGGLASLVWLFIFFKIPPLRSHLETGNLKAHPFETIQLALKSPNQQKALLFMVMLVFGQFTVIPFITPYMINNVGLAQDQIIYIYLVGGACTVISSPLIGRLVDRFGRKPVFFFMAIGSIAPLLLTTNLWPLPLYLVLCVSASFFIFISGRNIPANTMLTAVVKPQNRGGFMSLNSSCMSLASGAASLISGSIIVQGGEGEPLENYHWVGYLAIGFSLIAVLLATQLKELPQNLPVEPKVAE